MIWDNEDIRLAALFGLNIILSLATVFLHTMGSSLTHRIATAMINRIRRSPTIFDETLIISTVVVVLCLFHIMEIVVWAATYVELGAIKDHADALYFSLTTYTTLGPENVTFDHRFRTLGGFESLLGPLMIAWSTAIMATILTRIAALKLKK